MEQHYFVIKASDYADEIKTNRIIVSACRIVTVWQTCCGRLECRDSTHDTFNALPYQVGSFHTTLSDFDRNTTCNCIKVQTTKF